MIFLNDVCCFSGTLSQRQAVPARSLYAHPSSPAKVTKQYSSRPQPHQGTRHCNQTPRQEHQHHILRQQFIAFLDKPLIINKITKITTLYYNNIISSTLQDQHRSLPVVVQLLSSCCPVNDWTTTGQQLDNDWTTNGVGPFQRRCRTSVSTAKTRTKIRDKSKNLAAA